MIKKSFTWTNLNDEVVTEEFYFALSLAELAELEMSEKGGLTAWLDAIMKDQDGRQIMAKFKEIILASVGRRSLDGNRFIKNEEIRQDFLNSEPYSLLFMEIIKEPAKASEFVNGLVPKDMQEKIKDAQLPGSKSDQETDGDSQPVWVRENRAPNARELVGLSQAELIQAFQWREHLAGQASQ